MSAYNYNGNYPQQQQQSYGGYTQQQQPYAGYPQQQQQYGGYPQQQQQYGGGYPQQHQYEGGYYTQDQQQQQPPSYDDNFTVDKDGRVVAVEGGSSGGGRSRSPLDDNFTVDKDGRVVAVEGGWRSPLEEARQKQETDQFSGFSDKAVRSAFLQKVYAILMCQLLVTGAIMATIMFVQPIRDFVTDEVNSWLVWMSIGVTFACIIALVCCPGVRRKSPGNFICLFIFTVFEALMLGMVATTYEVDAVLMAVGTTAAVTLALTIFAFQTKIDFTGCGGALLCMLVVLMISGLFFAFIPSTRYAQIGYSAVGAVIFSLYIVYDTQLMLGGKHKHALSPEEYIFAALNLYLDIVNLFLYILAIFGGSKN